VRDATRSPCVITQCAVCCRKENVDAIPACNKGRVVREARIFDVFPRDSRVGRADDLIAGTGFATTQNIMPRCARRCHRDGTAMTVNGLTEVCAQSGHKQGLHMLERWIFAMQARTTHKRPIYIESRIWQVYAILRLSCMSCISTYHALIAIPVRRFD
jgi:hypothetical protein